MTLTNTTSIQRSVRTGVPASWLFGWHYVGSKTRRAFDEASTDWSTARM